MKEVVLTWGREYVETPIISTQSFCESKNAPGSLFKSESKRVVTVKIAKNSHQSVCSQRLSRHLKSHSSGVVGPSAMRYQSKGGGSRPNLLRKPSATPETHQGEWKALGLHGNENGEGAIAHRQTVTFRRPCGCVVVSLW